MSISLPATHPKRIQQKNHFVCLSSKENTYIDGGRSLMDLGDLDVWFGIATEATWLQ